MGRLKLATVWLGGCSGCHMSFLDLDEFLIDLADLADVVYTPIMDVKEYPEGVDVVLVEGAIANEEHLEMIRRVRRRTRRIIARCSSLAIAPSTRTTSTPSGYSLASMIGV